MLVLAPKGKFSGPDYLSLLPAVVHLKHFDSLIKSHLSEL